MRRVFLKWAEKALKNNVLFPSQPHLYKSVKGFFEDLYLPTIVYLFYANGYKDFPLFLEKLSYNELVEANQELHAILLKHIETVELLFSHYSSINVEILGDLHMGNSTTIKIGKHVYKRNQFGNELFVNQLMSSFPKYKGFFPKSTETKNHTRKQTFVQDRLDTSSKNELELYYYNLGFILPLFLFLRATDLNLQNVLCSLPYPIFFDTECLFSPQVRNVDSFHIGYTGFIQPDEDYDISIFSGGLKPITSYLKGALVGTRTKPKIKWITPSKQIPRNIPTLNGTKTIPYEYQQSITRGFNDGFDYVSKNKRELIELIEEDNPGTRVIVRATSQYRNVLLSYFYPQVYQKNPDPKEYYKNELAKKEHLLVFETDRARIHTLESKVLLTGAIPSYYTHIHSKDVCTPAGKKVGQLEVSQHELFIDHANKFERSYDENRELLSKGIEVSKNYSMP